MRWESGRYPDTLRVTQQNKNQTIRAMITIFSVQQETFYSVPRQCALHFTCTDLIAKMYCFFIVFLLFLFLYKYSFRFHRESRYIKFLCDLCAPLYKHSHHGCSRMDESLLHYKMQDSFWSICWQLLRTKTPTTHHFCSGVLKTEYYNYNLQHLSYGIKTPCNGKIPLDWYLQR